MLTQYKDILLPYKDYILLGFAVLTLFLLILAFWLVYRYCTKNHLGKLIIAKIKGNIEEADRIRLANIKHIVGVGKKSVLEKTSLQQLREELSLKEKKEDNKIITFFKTLKQKTSSLLYYSGLLDKGFSITTIFITLTITSIVVAILFGIFFNPVSSGIAFIGVWVLFWYVLSVIRTSKRDKLEAQMDVFINNVAQASMKYASFVDILKEVYPEVEEPLKSALQRCYVEAKQTYNDQLALKKLKENCDSKQFSFVIDCFDICSKTTNTYRKTTEDILGAITVFVKSRKQKQEIYRIGRGKTLLLGSVSVVIGTAIVNFLGGGTEYIFDTVAGNIELFSLIILFIYGATMRCKR